MCSLPLRCSSAKIRQRGGSFLFFVDLRPHQFNTLCNYVRFGNFQFFRAICKLFSLFLRESDFKTYIFRVVDGWAASGRRHCCTSFCVRTYNIYYPYNNVKRI
nr:MAG TPA: hypothetical protein [Caudoviricetes sp.]DAJ84568.1 MAG TPA: hypothetical protein [Caudoviricetes sp.]